VKRGCPQTTRHHTRRHPPPDATHTHTHTHTHTTDIYRTRGCGRAPAPTRLQHTRSDKTHTDLVEVNTAFRPPPERQHHRETLFFFFVVCVFVSRLWWWCWWGELGGRPSHTHTHVFEYVSGEVPPAGVGIPHTPVPPAARRGSVVVASAHGYVPVRRYDATSGRSQMVDPTE
jgi:hypothetical protein